MSEEQLLKLYNVYKDEFFMTKDGFKNAIKEILMLHKMEVSELQAKVCVYEKIIANSNFKFILETEVDLTEKDKRQIRGLIEEFKIGDKE